MKPSRVGVVGAGPAGAVSALSLARQGVSTVLFDPRAPWEKPCGGMLRPGLVELLASITGRDIRPITRLGGVGHVQPGGSVTLLPTETMCTVNRRILGQHLLEAALGAGVDFRRERVREIRRESGGWVLRTDAGQDFCDYLIGADGYHSLVRRTVSTPLPAEHTALAVGFFLPDSTAEECLFEYPAIEGYLWVFPRHGGVSIGAGARVTTITPKHLWAVVDEAVRRRYGDARRERWAGYLPLPSGESLFAAPIQGQGWLLVGDAAGQVDPFLGEGIYYAVQAGLIAASAIRSGDPDSYQTLWQEGEGAELERRAKLFGRLLRFSAAFGSSAFGSGLRSLHLATAGVAP